MANILITGASGNLGSMLCREFLHYNIFGLDINKPDRYKHKNFMYIPRDNFFIYDLSKGTHSLGYIYSDYIDDDVMFEETPKAYYMLEEYLIKNHIDIVIHCASKVNAFLSFIHQEEYYNSIVKGTDILLESINFVNRAYNKNIKIIYISSSAVYGKTAKTPFEEDSVRNNVYSNSVLTDVSIPNSPYGRYKLKAESLVDKYPVNAIILRCFNMFSDYFDPDNSDNFSVINKFLYLATMQYRYPEEKEKYKIVIDGDGTQSLTFMYMQNATKLIKHIVDTPDIKWDSDVYNVCPDIIDLISLKEVVDLLKIGFQTDLDVVYTNSFKNGDIHISYGDNTKAKEKLGFTYTYTFKNIFKRLINESKTSIIKQMDQQPF